MIRKTSGKGPNKYAVAHCHGAKKGKVIGKHRTKAEALAQHRAIQASKARKRAR